VTLTALKSRLSYVFKSALVRGLAIGGVVFFCTVGCKTTSIFSRKTYSKPSIESATAALAVIRESKNPAERRAAFEFLGDPSHLGSEDREEISSILALALTSEQQAQTRIVILQSLAKLGSPKRWDAYNASLQDKAPSVRVMACRLIGRSGSTEQTKALDSLLISDPNLDVRLASAEALSNIPTREAALALLSGVQDTDVAVRNRCRESLRHITGKDHGANTDEWRTEIQTANFDELATQRRYGSFVW
jgi:HEAT repeat protein